MYDHITIFLIVLGLFSVGLFPLLCFLPREVPLAFVVKLVWWCWPFLNLLVWKAFISPSDLNESFAGWNTSGYINRFFPFIILDRSCHSLLSVEKSADNLMGVPLYVMCCFSFVVFNILSLSLFLSVWFLCVSVCSSLGSSCLGLCFLDLDDYFLFHVREVFSYYLFKYFLGSLFSLSSPSGTPIMWMLVDLMLFQRSLSLSSFFF